MKVITYGDPDSGAGQVVIVPDHGEPYTALGFDVRLGTPSTVRLRLVTSGAASRDENQHTTAVTEGDGTSNLLTVMRQARSDWPELLNELVDQPGGAPDLMVRTAITASAVLPIVKAALTANPQASAKTLYDVGAYAAAFVVNAVTWRPTDHDHSALRRAVQGVVWWSMSGQSAPAIACRHHLTYLLCDKRLLRAIIEAATQDAGRGSASTVRRALLSDAATARWLLAAGDTQDVLFDYVIEQLEELARQSPASELSLTQVWQESGRGSPR
jgi:hypothetical protein